MFALVEQGKAIVTALQSVPGLKQAGYLDDERQAAPVPANMPVAWLLMEKCELNAGNEQATVSWAVVLKLKRLKGLDSNLPALRLVERIIEALHGFRMMDDSNRPVLGFAPLFFTQAEFMEPEVEAVTYLIRFITHTHFSRAFRPCPA